MQLALKGNRVVGYGNDLVNVCGTVICCDSGKQYPDAMIASYDGDIPSDIGAVGYEYHSGVLVPCAPFGEGDGSIAVIGECGEILNSGKTFNSLTNGEYGWFSNSSTQGTSAELVFNQEPKMLIVIQQNYLFVCMQGMTSAWFHYIGNSTASTYAVTVSWNGNTIKLNSGTATLFTAKNYYYAFS